MNQGKSPFSRVWRREVEVALSKKSQPVWFRIVKYILLAAFVYFFYQSPWFWPILGILLVLSLTLHFWYRYKTKGWTQSYGMWKYHETKSVTEEK